MMKTEKTIKQQARAALHGNASALIAMTGVVAAAYFLLNYAQFVLLYLFAPSGAADGTFSANDFNVRLIQSIYMLLLLFLSPLLNGALRGAAQAAVHGDCGARDVFYYFGAFRRWAKTVLINLLVYCLFAAAGFALNPGFYTRALLPWLYNAPLDWNIESFVVIFIDVVSVLLQICYYMLFVHFPLTAYALNENIRVEKCVFMMIGFSALHFGKLLRLLLSFAGWFALCFLVVPALYVIPYFAVASMKSAKWLFELDEGWDIV